jgi:hypothetical protein
MPSWNDLLNEVTSRSDAAAGEWLPTEMEKTLAAIGRLRGGRNVLLYGSSFLQKATAPPYLNMITQEDINGFMSTIYGMDWSRGLTLLLHTPGGITTAPEPLIAYLADKFDDIEVIVPAYAMSAGTMIALAGQRIVMGRQSQLGPIDPQMPVSNWQTVSARSIIDQFEQAKSEILVDRNTAHVWAPILQSLGPALLQEAQNALAYGERLVASWLEKRMFAGQVNAADKANQVARYFNAANQHKSHGKRIDRHEARSQGVVIEDLEGDQTLQEAVLTAYHLMTIIFERTPTTKLLTAHTGRSWMKNFIEPARLH